MTTSRLITYIPLSSVERIELRVINCRKTLSQVKAETKAHYVLDRGIWDPNSTPYPLFKVGGVMRSDAPWRAMGYVWDKGPGTRMTSEHGGVTNFIVMIALITFNKPVDKLSYGPARRDKRGCGAIGLRGSSLVLYYSGDGARDAAMSEALRDRLAGLDWISIAMLDRGGSSQCDFDGERITASRKVYDQICVYLKQVEQTSSDEERGMGRCRMMPNIDVNIRSGPSTSYGKVRAYPMGMVVDVLKTHDGWGRAGKGWAPLAYLEAVEDPQQVTDNGIVAQMYPIGQGMGNQSGGSSPCRYITIHKTDNAVEGADAATHGTYPGSTARENTLVSWHYTMDNHATIQHLPDYEAAHHVGDGRAGPSNTTSIGIEIYVNAGGDFEAAKVSATALIRLLMGKHGISIDRVVQYSHWNGKDCPKTTQATAGAWEAFLTLYQGRTADVSDLNTDVDTLAETGIINSPGCWRAGDYFVADVQALISRITSYVRKGE